MNDAVKWVGATMVLFAGTAYGFAQASRYAKRPKELRQLGAALAVLESEMVYGLTPLSEAFKRVASACRKPVSLLFADAADRMSDFGAERTAGDCWSEAIETLWPYMSLSEPEKASLLSLSPTLGVTDREDQAKHLRLVIAQLRAEEEAARDEQGKYGKMWKSLGALSAALIVILMY